MAGQVDVQSVMAHETGHIFGVAHGERGSCLESQIKSEKCSENIYRETMANYIFGGESCVRTLNTHDILNATTPP